MQIIRQASQLNTGSRKVCLAIGMFDGVHLGHQQLIRHTVLDARQHHALAVVVTFDRHPAAVLAPERQPALIYSLPQKLRAIGQLGVDAVLLLEFTRDFSRQTGEEFVRELVRGFGQLQGICVGSNFTFGYQRSGNVGLLKSLGEQLHFGVHGLAAVSLDGKIVSSTRIRDTIRKGELDAASQMLGRACSLAGRVVEGDKLGRKLGAPTANVDVTGLVVPPHGVYAVHALLNGEPHPAVVNIGSRPTLQAAQSALRCEVHLLDFEGDLYGAELEIVFIEKIREEQKFDSLEALRTQIHADIQAARERLG